jgi:hypothetical protein
MLAVGLLFLAVGVGSFFTALGGFGSPRYFWCAFVGMPLIFVGTVMCSFAFLGAVSRYQAGEVAPVAKDAFNYMASGTQSGVRKMATAVGSGLADGIKGGTTACPHCGHANDQDARFCDECGTPLSKSCSSCGRPNDGDARFCDSCGAPLPT